MMRALARFSVTSPVLVNLYLCVILLVGLVLGTSIRREFFPEVRPNEVLITAPFPGATPEQVESALLIKIEDAIVDLENIKEVSSTAGEGSGTVRVQFYSSEPIQSAVDKIQRRIDGLDDLPEEAERIVVRELEPNLPVISLNLSPTYGPDGRPSADERALKRAIIEIRDDLRRLPGMGTIALSGVRTDEIAVAVRPDKLLEHGLSLTRVADAISRATSDLPGGAVRTDTATISVRTVAADETAQAVRGIVVRGDPDGSVLRLGEIAEVRSTFRDVSQSTTLNGAPAVTATAFKVGRTQDAVEIAQTIRGYVAGRLGQAPTLGFLDRVKSSLGLDVPYTVGYRAGQARGDPPPGRIVLTNDLSRFITGRLELLTRNALSGGLVVFVVLLAMLNWRVALWVTTGLVTAVFGTLISMSALGVTLNLLTMFGLIIVLGMLVDDGIVVAENIYARWQRGEPPLTAAIEGTAEVAWPVVATVSTTVFAFTSLLLIEGRIGDFFGVLTVIVAIALGVSLTEAILSLPGHMGHTLRKLTAGTGRFDRAMLRYDARRDAFLERALYGPYERMLRWCVRRRYLTLSATVAALIVSVGLLAGGRVKFTFLGSSDSETIVGNLRMAVGSPLSETARVVSAIERAALAQPEVSYVFAQAGAQTSLDGTDGGSAGNIGQVFIELRPVEERQAMNGRKSDQLIVAIREAIGDPPGVRSLRLDSIQGGPEGPPLQYTITAPDPRALPAAVERVRRGMGSYAGVYGVSDDADPGQRELRIELLPGASELGFAVADVARQVRGSVFGIEAHTFASEYANEDVDVRVFFDEPSRRSLAAIESQHVFTPDGRAVPLSEVARISESRAFATIRRLDQRRAVTLTSEVDQAVVSPEAVAAQLQPLFGAIISESAGAVRIVPRGRQQETRESLESIPYGFAAAMLLIFVNLCWVFKSYTQPVIILTTVPFAVIGMIVGHLVMGYDMTVLSLIGFVALAGVVVNNAIVLVEFYNTHRKNGVPALEAAVMCGPQRLRPVLLTSLTTIGGLGPLILEQSFQAQFLIPMAITICGGLLSSTVLVLVMVPALLVIYDDAARLLRFLWSGRGIAEAMPIDDWDRELSREAAAVRP
ncbi:MAG: hypothetical protein C0475_08500 [Planctomyces sp.]|nr:hypothetical protein [Planctomyces sp.]